MKKWMALLMSVLALGLVAAGCGDDDDDDENGNGAATTEQPAPADTGAAEETAPAGGEELTLTASESEISWEPNELSAPAGEVTITLTNPSPQIPHNVALEGGGANEQGETVTGGDTSTVTAELEPGEYTYFCSVGDHRQTMEGTLTVE